MLPKTIVKENISYASPHFLITMPFNLERYISKQTVEKWRRIAF